MNAAYVDGPAGHSSSEHEKPVEKELNENWGRAEEKSFIICKNMHKHVHAISDMEEQQQDIMPEYSNYLNISCPH